MSKIIIYRNLVTRLTFFSYYYAQICTQILETSYSRQAQTESIKPNRTSNPSVLTEIEIPEEPADQHMDGSTFIFLSESIHCPEKQ